MNLSAVKRVIQTERSDRRIALVRSELIRMKHSPMLVEHQLGLLSTGYRGVDLHDDTCAIITSEEYLAI
jgi:hypothetical protein